MKRISLILFISVLFSCQSNRTGKKARDVKQYTIEQFYQNENIFAGGFSPDENYILATSNRSGIYNAIALPVDGSEPTPLTQSTKESVFAISYFPDDHRILYSSDQGGNEIDHIFVRNTDGSTQDLTPWENAKSQFFEWSRDGKSFYFISNKRDSHFFDLYTMSTKDFSSKMIYENKEGLDVSAISSDGKYLALNKTITEHNVDMYLYNMETEELKYISEHEGDVVFFPQFFDLANNYLYFLSDQGSEFTYLMRHNLESGEKEKVFETNWDVWYAYNSWNEKYRVIGINQDGQTVVKIFNLEDNSGVEFPDFEDGSVSSVTISKREDLMRFTLSSSKMPSNIYVYDFSDGKYKQLTNTLNPEIDPDDLVTGKVIRYKSYDGLDIPSIYYQPHQASETSKVPGLVWVHGGPGGQSRLGYFTLIQYLVNHGYAVLAVNNRGSGGYGKTFNKMDNQKHGDVDLRDCVEAKKFFENSVVVDMDKVGIIGGSYGGYMVMAALTFQPEAFKVGVDIFGVTNWIRTLRSIPPWWESFKDALYEEMGNPNTEDSVRLYKISPLFHAENVTKPLMVLQGVNDPRVLKVESDEIVEKVKANGVPVEYVVFDDEGHGFVKKENEIEGYRKIRIFLDKYLKGEQERVESKAAKEE